jgi:hypothetical protein
VEGKVLSLQQFDQIAWEYVPKGLHSTRKIFQVWACKQVWDIASTNYLWLKWDDKVDAWCPGCRWTKKTSAHMLMCNEVGRVETLQALINFLEDWLDEVEMEATLQRCIVRYARSRGFKTMEEICHRLSVRYTTMTALQDVIGWRRFMEDMVSKQIVSPYAEHGTLRGEGILTKKWACQLVVQLLEITHGQLVYRNI